MIKYFTIEELIQFIDEPNRKGCQALLNFNEKLFTESFGSTHNHQAWKGGYLDHITDGMNLIVLIYNALLQTNRKLPFSLSDALLVFFLHDIEKPWKYKNNSRGEREIIPELRSKKAQHEFRIAKIQKYGIKLTDDQLNALTYVEGEGDKYSADIRTMNELCALCHAVDNFGARLFFNYPLSENDPWKGAKRCNPKL